MTTAPTDDASLEAGSDPEEVDPDAPVLALPTELVLDEAAQLRLERQLAAAPEEVLGVVAICGEIPSGSSTRVQAERAAMAAMNDVTETTDGSFHGAVLLRPGARFELTPTSVQVDGGPLVVDRGAVAHDPWRPQGAPHVAGPDARPPFRWRPVVVLLGLEPDLDLAETARGLANGLLARDVEARLAVPEAPDGFYLTQPCRPVPESVQALDPDVVIALDPTALGVAPGWCGTNRSTTVVELTQDITYGIRLVSWRIGAARGPVAGPGRPGRRQRRAGPTGQPSLLRSPAPASSRGRSRPTAARPSASTGPSPSPTAAPAVGAPPRGGTVVAIGPVPGAAPSTHLHALVTELGAAGSTVHRATVGSIDPDLVEAAPLVVVSSSTGVEAIQAVMERRSARDRRTLVDLEPGDAVEAARDAGPASLRPDLDAMCVTGFTVTTSLAIAEGVRGRSNRSQVVPYLTDRTHIATLEQCGEERAAPERPVVGWRIGAAGPAPAPIVAALSRLVDTLLAEGVLVELVASGTAVPEGLAGRPGLAVRTDEPTPAELADWTAQIWTPPAGWAELTGDLRPVVEAGFAGVPTVIGGPDRAALAGLADLNLVVDHVDRHASWADVIESLLDDDVRARAGRAPARPRSPSTVPTPTVCASPG